VRAAAQLQNFRYLGVVPNKDLAAYYSASDLLLVPSLYEEGFGRVVCEAFSCGLPVLASDRGGLREAITPEVGLLAEPDTEAVSSALGTWRRKQGTTLAVRQACRAHAESRFSEKNAQNILDYLKQLTRCH